MILENALCKKQNWNRVIIGAGGFSEQGTPVRQLIAYTKEAEGARTEFTVIWMTKHEMSFALDGLEAIEFGAGAAELSLLFPKEEVTLDDTKQAIPGECNSRSLEQVLEKYFVTWPKRNAGIARVLSNGDLVVNWYNGGGTEEIKYPGNMILSILDTDIKNNTELELYEARLAYYNLCYQATRATYERRRKELG